ncbi:MAG TPA: peptidase M13, partial [Mycobacterium sp.]|nr:peptidase M13 [Mycobacterium sp.]
MTVEVFRSGIDLSYVDAGARPQDDLFGHVNGRWLADHRMPADRATDGAFRLLADRAEEQVRDIITEAAAANAAEGTDPQRIGDLYASFMDTETIAGLGVRPLLDELAGVDAALTPAQLTAELGELQRTGIGGGTGVYVDTDAKDSTRYLLHMSQSGLGLPD